MTQLGYDPTGQFLLEMPLSKAQAAAEALHNAGIHFEPVKAITGATRTVGRYANHTGINLQDVVDAINHYYWENRMPDGFHKKASSMTLPEAHAVLTFSTQYCDWSDNVPPYLTYVEPEGWQEMKVQHPCLVIDEQGKWLLQFGVNLKACLDGGDWIQHRLLSGRYGVEKTAQAMEMLSRHEGMVPDPTVDPIAANGDEWPFLMEEFQNELDNAMMWGQVGLADAMRHGINLIEQRCYVGSGR